MKGSHFFLFMFIVKLLCIGCNKGIPPEKVIEQIKEEMKTNYIQERITFLEILEESEKLFDCQLQTGSENGILVNSLNCGSSDINQESFQDPCDLVFVFDSNLIELKLDGESLFKMHPDIIKLDFKSNGKLNILPFKEIQELVNTLRERGIKFEVYNNLIELSSWKLYLKGVNAWNSFVLSAIDGQSIKTSVEAMMTLMDIANLSSYERSTNGKIFEASQNGLILNYIVDDSRVNSSYNFYYLIGPLSYSFKSYPESKNILIINENTSIFVSQYGITPMLVPKNIEDN